MTKFVLFALLGLLHALPQHLFNPTISETDDSPALRDDIIDHVNSRRTTWIASRNAKFEGLTLGQAKGLMGSKSGGPMPPLIDLKYDVEDLPESFDAREQWPDCPSVSLVRDQSACGSCWAFGSTEAFNDRLCISTGNKEILAPADVLGCCEWTCGDGCGGGYPQSAWNYFTHTGSVTESCFNYPFPACAHHVVSPQYPPCPTADYKSPKCNTTCADGSVFEKDKVKAKSTYSIGSEQDIMKELSSKGPVTAAFTVYQDFLAYQNGTYQHVTGGVLGGHAVEIIGYGVDDKGVKYWTVKNSWNPAWGDKGFFNILRGQNECGIEGSIVSGDV